MNVKTPYEIRLELLKMAQDQSNQRFYNQWEQAARKAEINENASLLTEVPEFPTAETILNEASKLKKFIDNSWHFNQTMIDYRLYTEEELDIIQKQMIEQSRKASEVAKTRGYQMDPRIRVANLK